MFVKLQMCNGCRKLLYVGFFSNWILWFVPNEIVKHIIPQMISIPVDGSLRCFVALTKLNYLAIGKKLWTLLLYLPKTEPHLWMSVQAILRSRHFSLFFLWSFYPSMFDAFYVRWENCHEHKNNISQTSWLLLIFYHLKIHTLLWCSNERNENDAFTFIFPDCFINTFENINHFYQKCFIVARNIDDVLFSVICSAWL